MNQKNANHDLDGDQSDPPNGTRADVELLLPEDESLLHEVERNPRVLEAFQRRFHSGPLPSSEDMVEYNHVIPDGADRIMRMAEKEQEGRLTQTAKNSDSFFKMKARGQRFGLSVVILFSILAGYLFMKEQYGLGVVLLGANLASIVAVFLADRYFHNKDES